MSMDRSLRSASSLVRHRNVLTRAERVARLESEELWRDGRGVLGLPKVGNRKMTVGKSTDKKEETPADGTAAPAAAAAAPAADPKAAAKPAAKPPAKKGK